MERKVYDIHAHIAPAVDDGASNLKMSIEMLFSAYKQGIRKIVCTSHNYGNIEQYYESFNALKHHLNNLNINIDLYTGCEIYCSSNRVNEIVADLNKNKLLTINNTKYVLVEFYPYTIANEIIYCVQQLHNNGYQTILAHTERYPSLFKNNIWLMALQNLGCLFQINAYSLYNETNTQIKSYARQLLANKLVTFLGSDAHRTNYRPYSVNNGVNYIYEHCDIRYANDICHKNAKRILNMN